MGTGIESAIILSDIEGSSGCWNRAAAAFMTDEWYRACGHMSLDVNAAVKALLEAGVRRVAVHDFHRTGYNLLKEWIDPRAAVFSGYRKGPVPGVGNPGGAQVAIFLGMHAPSGSHGFLAHTLTSRIGRLEVNGRLMGEVELFSASLAPFQVRPVFFSGCPVACTHARNALKDIHVHPIDKTIKPEDFRVDSWRARLGKAAVKALENDATQPYAPAGPFRARLTMRGGEEQAEELARPWGFAHEGPNILIETPDIHQLYNALIRLCYLRPFTQRVLPLVLLCQRLVGRYGLARVRRYWKANRLHGPGSRSRL